MCVALASKLQNQPGLANNQWLISNIHCPFFSMLHGFLLWYPPMALIGFRLINLKLLL
jgi:hypothetical protein